MVKRLAQVPVDAKDRPQTPIVISNCGELELRKPKSEEQPKRLFAISFSQHHDPLGFTQEEALKVASVMIVAPDHVVRTASVAGRSRKSGFPNQNQNPSVRILKDWTETPFHKRQRNNMMHVWNVKNKNGWRRQNVKSWSGCNDYMRTQTQHKVSVSKVC